VEHRIAQLKEVSDMTLRIKTMDLMRDLSRLQTLAEDGIRNLRDWEIGRPTDATATLGLGDTLRDIRKVVEKMAHGGDIAQERDQVRQDFDEHWDAKRRLAELEGASALVSEGSESEGV
jgi:hypothetical protein